jgi:hypothetical protein
VLFEIAQHLEVQLEILTDPIDTHAHPLRAVVEQNQVVHGHLGRFRSGDRISVRAPLDVTERRAHALEDDVRYARLHLPHLFVGPMPRHAEHVHQVALDRPMAHGHLHGLTMALVGEADRAVAVEGDKPHPLHPTHYLRRCRW